MADSFSQCNVQESAEHLFTNFIKFSYDLSALGRSTHIQYNRNGNVLASNILFTITGLLTFIFKSNVGHRLNLSNGFLYYQENRIVFLAVKNLVNGTADVRVMVFPLIQTVDVSPIQSNLYSQIIRDIETVYPRKLYPNFCDSIKIQYVSVAMNYRSNSLVFNDAYAPSKILTPTSLTPVGFLRKVMDKNMLGKCKL